MAAAFLAQKSPSLAGIPYKVEPLTVYRIAEEMKARYFTGVDPLMVTAMAQIESSFKPGAVRGEPHIQDASIGLMQTLYGTARWLHDKMGFRDYQLVNEDSLMDPQTSIYYGMAYISWLTRYRGRSRSEDWIVMSYNGGPGANNSMTRNHLRKYKDAKQQLKSQLGV